MPMYIERIKTMVSKALNKPKSKMVSVNKQHLLEDIGITKKETRDLFKMYRQYA